MGGAGGARGNRRTAQPCAVASSWPVPEFFEQQAILRQTRSNVSLQTLGLLLLRNTRWAVKRLCLVKPTNPIRGET